MTFSVVQVSDPHLTDRNRQTIARLDAARGVVDALSPALVVVTGDVSEDGATSPESLALAKSELDLLSAPVVSLPGNHDVGNAVGLGMEVTEDKVDAWNAVFARDRFRVDIEQWTLLGINSQIAGSGFDGEAEQDAWLAAELRDAGDRPVALFLHTAVWAGDETDSDDSPDRYWTLPLAQRQRLLDLIDRSSVRLVAGGHVHCYRHVERKGVQYVWCPSVYFIVGSPHAGPEGARLGLIEYTFEADTVSHRLHPMPAPFDRSARPGDSTVALADGRDITVRIVSPLDLDALTAFASAIPEPIDPVAVASTDPRVRLGLAAVADDQIVALAVLDVVAATLNLSALAEYRTSGILDGLADRVKDFGPGLGVAEFTRADAP